MDEMGIDLTNARGKLIVGIYADDHKTLIRMLMEAHPKTKVPFILRINMPCGERVTFYHIMNIPSRDMYCPCGNKDHIFIKYRNNQDN